MPSHSHRKSKRVRYSSWKEWDPAGYLETYFHDLRRDEDETLRFLVKNTKKLSQHKKLKVLEFGSGPTVVHGLVVAPVAKEIHFADYLEKNLSEVAKWLNDDNNAFQWDLFTRRILQLENRPVTDKAVGLRSKDLRQKVKKLLLADARLAEPLKGTNKKYDLIIMTYCLDSATASKKIWRGYMRNVLGLLSPKGTILMAALHKCKFYMIGEEHFPSANISEDDVKNSLEENGFKPTEFEIEVKEVPECAEEGYNSLIFARARKG